MLANLYLHWFDKRFHRNEGPGHWANAKLVRYADDFVILAWYIDHGITNWVERTLEDWMGLTLNREKTQVVNLQEQGASLDFLGYTFRDDRDLWNWKTADIDGKPNYHPRHLPNKVPVVVEVEEKQLLQQRIRQRTLSGSLSHASGERVRVRGPVLYLLMPR